MNEVKIQIPDNCELIKNGDTYIVKEKKQIPPRSWEEFCERYPLHENEVYFDENGEIRLNLVACGKKRCTPNWIINKQEAEAFLALMQLRQLRKAWVGDWEIPYLKNYGVIYPDAGILRVATNNSCGRVLSFPTKEMAKDFLNCFRYLCETAKPLL